MRFFLIVALFVVFAFVSARDSNSNETKSRESSEKRTHPCQQPIIIGPCRALIKRWAFDQRTNRCREFSYGGCQGNKNNFKTLKECQNTCKAK
ncbi:hypothetical protein WR25_17674 [Diploscapter pachys]|uniref:BPTI/Kunitz inhibitor domain-containing protein n=1 Tax=Diploscapter pachys TaxID=2018661 RepID=A0A2A2KBP5_9BILA|nr:hypothetical protein WR25_17674 [Diploscapter pachys]